MKDEIYNNTWRMTMLNNHGAETVEKLFEYAIKAGWNRGSYWFSIKSG
jgi:hypothetical protein